MRAPMIDGGQDARRLLGGVAVDAFLRRHWQKRAHLVRGAIPGFSGGFDRRSLVMLAMRDDVESRLVVRERGRWSLAHGPFRAVDFRSLPARGWTLLVQGLNLHSRDADALLRRFSFLPFARLDDLMASYAVPGGGVGPHVDSYDVFLLQGVGRRRWRYGRQRDLSLRPNLTLKILVRFTPEHDHVLEPGDMLYLPPHVAHDGVAVDECMTYSIGFRAASAQEFATAFLDWLRDRIALDGRYTDPDLAQSREPARVDARMQGRVGAMLDALHWDADAVGEFLGSFLSEPKPTVFFDRPEPPLARGTFRGRLARHGIELDRRTQLLYDDRRLYINGIAVAIGRHNAAPLHRLANARTLDAASCAALSTATLGLLHDWYRDGYVNPGA